MNTSEKSSFSNFFSHIYIEQEAYDYPLTGKILSFFPHSHTIEIKHYKDIFDRMRQDCSMQKKSPALILAVKHNDMIYKGAPVCQSFGNEYFYYTSNILNCIYNCDYCYLGGMYPSAHIVIFVNTDDFFAEVEKMLSEHPVYLCISYDTDLMAFENMTGLVSSWIDFASLHNDLKLEIRTKSAFSDGFSHWTPSENIIFAWTLSPDEIIEEFEHRTPGLDSRIAAIKHALAAGFTLRLCFDPMIYVPGYQKIYSDMYRKVFSEIPSEKLLDVSLGLFRISSGYMNVMRKRYPNEITSYPFTGRCGICSYDEKRSREMLDFARSELTGYIDPDKINEI